MLIIYIVIVLALGLVVGTAITRGIERALPVAAFFFVLIPRDAGIPVPGLFDITVQRVVLVALAVLYVFLPQKSTDKRRIRTPLLALMLLHVVWCLISTANSIVPAASAKKMISVLLEYYLMYYIFFHSIKDKGTIRRVLAAIVAAVSVASVFGAVEAYSDWTVMEWFPAVAHRFENWSTTGAMSGREARVSSTFDHAILFGAGLAIAIPLALYLLQNAKKTSAKVLLWCALLLMFLNIYKTESRGPWLALAFAFALLLVLEKGKVKRYLTVLVILMVSVCVIRPGVWQTVANIYYASFDPNSPLGSSYEYRYALPRVAAQALSRSAGRAVFGFGMESFYELHLTGNLLGKPYPFLSCDNAWMEATIETGYGGGAILASLLLLSAWGAWQIFLGARKGDRDLNLYFAISMTIYYVMMLSVAMYGWGQTGYMLWMIIAMSQASSKLAQQTGGPGTRVSVRANAARPSPSTQRIIAPLRSPQSGLVQHHQKFR